MAIKEEEQKKNGMKIVDNMDGMKNATQKLNMIEQSTTKLELLDPSGTIVLLYCAVPLTRLYPPFISGSKFCSIRASPGDIENTSLLSVKPPAQLTTNGDIRSVVGIY